MTTSVAICTYNGEKYLSQQLDSILNQTKLVDEIIICDDGSADATVSILEIYKEKYPIIKVFKNKINLRSVKNFEKAISLCTNDLIFLSDQDDIWCENKVNDYVDFFNNNLEIDVIASNGYFIDSKGTVINKKSVWDIPELLQKSEITFDFFDVITHVENIATGASICLRKKMLPCVIPFPIIEKYHHDEWIVTIAAKNKSFVFLNKKYFYYRIHSDQQVGGVFINDFDSKEKYFKQVFDLNSKIVGFKTFKIKIKRLLFSLHKNKELYDYTKNQIFKENILKIEESYKQLIQDFTNNHPILSRLLFVSDKILNKRQLKDQKNKL